MNNYFDQIEDYVNGDLKGESLIEFEKHLYSNSDLMAETKRFSKIVIRLHDLQLKRQIKSSSNLNFKRSKLIRNFIFIGIILFAILIIYLILFINSDSNQINRNNHKDIKFKDTIVVKQQVLANSNLEYSDTIYSPKLFKTKIELKKINRGNSDLFNELVASLNTSDYTIMGNEEKDVKLEKYINEAKTYLKSNNTDSAMQKIKFVLLSENALYREEAEWIYAVIYVQKDIEIAKDKLKKIANNPAHLYRIDALKLINKMK